MYTLHLNTPYYKSQTDAYNIDYSQYHNIR